MIKAAEILSHLLRLILVSFPVMAVVLTTISSGEPYPRACAALVTEYLRRYCHVQRLIAGGLLHEQYNMNSSEIGFGWEPRQDPFA